MTSPVTAPAAELTIQSGKTFCIDGYEMTVLSYEGQFAEQVWYFTASIKSAEVAEPQQGLLRIGRASADNALAKELAIRADLETYQMIAPVMVQAQQEAVVKTVIKTGVDDKTIQDETVENTAVDNTAEKNKSEEPQALASGTAKVVVAQIKSPTGDSQKTVPSQSDIAKSDESAQPSTVVASETAESEVEQQQPLAVRNVGLSGEDTEEHEAPASESSPTEPLDPDTQDDAQDAVEEADIINAGLFSQSPDQTKDEPNDTASTTVPEDSPQPPKNQDADTAIATLDADNNLENSELGQAQQEEYLEDEFLEEEYHEEKDTTADTPSEKIIIFSAYPADDDQTLADWLNHEHSQEENLSVLIQICQFFRYLHQRNWCFAHFLPQFVQLAKPVQFYDLTGACAVGSTITTGLHGLYCAPELSYQQSNKATESLSSYIIGTLLHQLMGQSTSTDTLPLTSDNTEPPAIPRIYQLLKICLSPVPEERFPLGQLMEILLSVRQALRTGTITWETAHRSTVGLSTARLQNEDSYGVRQQQLSNSDAMMMGILADGMGGMAEGDVASKLAVKTFLEAPIPEDVTTDEQTAQWLESLVDTANTNITSVVNGGGTTLSVVLARNSTLTLAHVGDSRIYLLRKGSIRQISEDHSYVAMLVASGQITHEESLEHPDRNMLTKSLGSKGKLMNGYVQTMKHWDEGASMPLEDGDTLLLCSDGVWDLVSDTELQTTFTETASLRLAVDNTIESVLARGASDNATLLALRLHHDTNRPD